MDFLSSAITTALASRWVTVEACGGLISLRSAEVLCQLHGMTLPVSIDAGQEVSLYAAPVCSSWGTPKVFAPTYSHRTSMSSAAGSMSTAR